MLKTLIKPEKITTGKIYTFNVNYRNPLGSMSWRDLIILYKILFKKIQEHCFITMYPEFSPLMKLHYHGTIQFKHYNDIIPAYMILEEADAGIEIDTIEDYNWYVYCNKQRYLLEPFMMSKLRPYQIHT